MIQEKQFLKKRVKNFKDEEVSRNVVCVEDEFPSSFLY